MNFSKKNREHHKTNRSCVSKKLITIIMLLLVVMACKKENNPINKFKEAAEKVKEAKQGLNNLEKIAKRAEDLQKNIKKLAETTPMTNETIKAWMPKELGNLKRTEYEIGKQMGFAKISNVYLTFKDEEEQNRSIKMSIIDGAGNGSSIVSMFNLTFQVDVDSENNTGYKRTETFDGQKVLVDYSNPEYANRSLFKYIIKDRFIVEARGWSMKPDELWKHLKQLEIEKLAN